MPSKAINLLHVRAMDSGHIQIDNLNQTGKLTNFQITMRNMLIWVYGNNL